MTSVNPGNKSKEISVFFNLLQIKIMLRELQKKDAEILYILTTDEKTGLQILYHGMILLLFNEYFKGPSQDRSYINIKPEILRGKSGACA